MYIYIYIYPPKSIPQLFKNHLFLTKKSLTGWSNTTHILLINESRLATLERFKKSTFCGMGRGKSRNTSVEAGRGSIWSMEIIVFLTKNVQRNLSETKWLKKKTWNTNSPTKNPWTNTSQVLNICSLGKIWQVLGWNLPWMIWWRVLAVGRQRLTQGRHDQEDTRNDVASFFCSCRNSRCFKDFYIFWVKMDVEYTIIRFKVSRFNWIIHLHIGYFALDSSCCAARSKRNCRAVRDLATLDDVWKWDTMTTSQARLSGFIMSSRDVVLLNSIMYRYKPL